MALPKIDTPVYDLELPLSKKKIRFRPFLVKEEKKLLILEETSNKKEIYNGFIKYINEYNRYI